MPQVRKAYVAFLNDSIYMTEDPRSLAYLGPTSIFRRLEEDV